MNDETAERTDHSSEVPLPKRRELREAADPSVTTGDSEQKGESRNVTAARKKGGLRGVISAIGTGLMGGLLVVFVAIGVLAIAVPALTGSTALTVRTSSMEPGIPAGSMVVVRPTPIEEIKPGNVITFQLKSGEPTLVTHRVTQRLALSDGSPVFVTKGDANPSPDPDHVIQEQVRGTVWYTIPYVGWITQVLTGDTRAIVVTAVVALLFVYAAWMFVSSLRDRRRGREEEDAPIEQ